MSATSFRSLTRAAYLGKRIAFVSVTLAVICSAVVYAQTTAEEYEIGTIVVFPDEISSESWINIETLNEQNLVDSSLYQQFSTENSAYLPNARGANESIETTEGDESGGSTLPANDAPADSDAGNPTTEDSSNDTDNEASGVLDPQDGTQETPVLDESSSTTVLRRVTDAVRYVYTSIVDTLPFMQAETTVPLAEEEDLGQTVETEESKDTSSQTDEPGEVISDGIEETEEEVSDETEQVEATAPDETETVSEDKEPDVENENTTDTNTDTPESTPPITATSTEKDVPQDTDTTIPAEDNSSVIETEEETPVMPQESIAQTRSITLKGFGLPLEKETEVTGGQLRMSFAAKEKERFDDRDHSLSINYSLDNGESWQSNGFIDIDDEVSNSINGGYFLFALPEIVSVEQLGSLVVEVNYVGDSTILDGIYLDSAWLELFIAQPRVANATSTPFILPESGYTAEPLAGDELVLPDGTTIDFTFTDDNAGETLIIKSDERSYTGLTEAVAYFNVTNTSDEEDTFTLQTHFGDGSARMVSLEEWEQNKSYELIVPEYRPYVYHCAAGWEEMEEPLVEDFSDFQSLFPLPDSEPENTEPRDDPQQDPRDATSTPEGSAESMGTTSETENIEVESIDRKNEEDTAIPLDVDTEDPFETLPATSTNELIAVSLDEAIATSAPTTTLPPDVDVSDQPVVDENDLLDLDTAESGIQYSCGETNVIRTCDVIEGDGTSCRIENKKVAEHAIEQFRPGWNDANVASGTPPDTRGLIKRALDFFGFGVERKEIPEAFNETYHAESEFTVRPGETKYFKMEIRFDPFTEGEFWIEAVGESTVYGLLDPFWSSLWTYRMPVTLDNTASTEDLTEHQVFLELDNTLADFWSNVNEDGSDIRFIQETPGNVDDWFGAKQITHDWYDFDWGFRTEIAIQSSQIDSGLSDFPVFVDLSDLGAGFFANVESDGADIRVTEGDGQTELPYELVSIDTGGETGELHFKATALSSGTDTSFYIYYGNASAAAYSSSDTYGSENVWTNGYEAVYHFEEDPSGISPQYADSTGNSQGTSQNMEGVDQVDGLVGNAADIDGVNEHIETNFSQSLLASTWSIWLIADGTQAVCDAPMFSRGTNVSGINIGGCPDADEIGYHWNDGAGSWGFAGGPVYPTNEWFMAAMVVESTQATLYALTDTATLSGSNVAAHATSTIDNLDFGWDSFGVGRSFDGRLDEARLSSVVRSEDWLEAEFRNASNTAVFYTTSADETPPSLLEIGDWQYRIPITIQSSEVNGPLTDFPVYVDLTDLGNEFFNSVEDSGEDIRITEGDGVTELPYELVSIDTGSEIGELYFKAPSVSDTDDTTFYLYFGNSEASGYDADDEFGAENVWTNNFEAVFHFEEDPGSSAPQFNDSTGNGHNASADLMDSGNQTLGSFGFGVDANGTNESVIAPGFTGLGTSDQPYAIGIWFNADIGETDGNVVGMSLDNPPNNWRIPMLLLDADNLDGFSWPGSSRASGVTAITQSDWYQGYTTWSSAVGLDVYLNGSNEDNTTQGTFSASGGSNFLHIAGDVAGGAGDEGHFDGKIDELRVYSTTVSSEWIGTEYNNQASSNTFYSTSTLESITPTTFSELDFWVQYFSTTTEESDIWVQVDSLPAGASTTIYLYYGNVNAVSASDELETFTHSTLTDTYYVVDDVSTGDIEVYSLIDNNIVQLDSGTQVALDAGETTVLSGYSGASVIRTLGPISATINDDGTDAVVPIAFASTTFAIPNNRNSSVFYVFSPFSTSSVQTFVGGSGTADESFSVPPGTVVTSNTDATGNNGVIIEASEPVLIYHLEAGGRDGLVIYPPTTRDIYGIDSNNTQITTVTNSPDPDVYCSGGSTGSVTGITRGEEQGENTCSQGAEGSGDAVRFANALFPIAAIQQGDSDGNDSSMFIAQHEFSTEYYLPTDTAYVAVACSPRFGTVNLEVRTNGGSTVESGTCTPSGDLPGKAYFVNGGNGDTLAFTAGHVVVATNDVPFYAMYEDDEEDNDETNVWGSVQGRKFSPSTLTAVFGAEEINIDAEYEQLSYGWYENEDAETPTSRWPLDGAGGEADEGQPITGEGAVNTGEVLRLRMNLRANNATGTINSTAFKLQYAEAELCDAAESWSDVGDIGSSTAAFNGYNNASVSDGSILSSTTLALSTEFGTYEEQNLSSFIQTQIDANEVAEWDWVIENNAAVGNASYCFRMVRDSNQELVTYTTYPQLETAGPPFAPTLSVYFDNERTPDLEPVLEFATTDASGDEIHYQMQIDDDITFGSVAIDRNSIAHINDFENISTPADKSPFNNGAPIRFTSLSSLSPTTTYWWRVRGRDPDGSDTWGDWSEPFSFTTDGSVTVSEWHQTTGDQFSTNELTSLATSSGTVSVSGGTGTMVSTPIDFDNATVGNAWGEFSWNDTETSGTILYQVEYLNGSSWTLVPDSEIANNSIGNGVSPINILGLDTDTYNVIRLVASFSGATLSLEDWTVRWSERVSTPLLDDPFDNEKIATTTPRFSFLSTDPQDDDLEYEISWSSDVTFMTGSTTRNSGVDSGFENLSTPLDTDPFNSGDTVAYTTPSGDAFTDGETYWWRVRAKDPNGGNAWSPWSDPDSFTVDTAVTVSTWFQTTDEQFDKGTLVRTETSGDAVVFSTSVGQIAVYREATAADAITTSVFDHTWDTTVREDTIYSLSGNSDIILDSGYYAVMYSAQFDSTSGTNRSEIQSFLSLNGGDVPSGWSQGFIRRNAGADEAFTSGGGIVRAENDGDALALHSFRTDVNGAGVARAANTSGIHVLRLDNSWDYLRLGKDTDQAGPTGASWINVTYDRQDEVDSDTFEHDEGSADVVLKTAGHYLVFANTYGAITTNDRSQVTQKLTLDGSDIEGSFTSVYLRGDQNSEETFEGSTAIGMIIETTEADQVLNVELTRDQGTTAFTLNEDDAGTFVDRTALTVVKLTDADFVRLTDSGTDDMNPAALSPMGWDTEEEIDTSFVHSTVTNNERIEIDVDDDYLFLSALYGENNGGTIRKYYSQGWRINGGSLLSYGQAGQYDREAAGADDAGNFSGIIMPGMTDGDYVEVVTQELGASGAMAADFKGVQGFRIGSLAEADTQPIMITSPDIVFSDGAGPKWGEFSWNDVEPGTSAIDYQIVYQTAPDAYALIPDVDLPGNSSGFSTSPVDLSDVDVQIYDTIRLVGNFTCDGATCPSLSDWTLEWSEGAPMTGTLQEYDHTTNVASGTVRVAVNGTLLPSTGTVSNGAWSVNNVTAFAGDIMTVFVDGANDENEAVAAFVYDGSGDMTGVELFERHLSLSADENATTTNALLSSYDNSVSGDEDIFFDVNAFNDLEVCAVSGCGSANLYIGAGNVYIPDTSGSGNIETHDLINDGRVDLDANTMRVGGSWDNNAIFNHDTSTVIFTATSTAVVSPAWYNASWDYRIPITIDASLIDSDLSDFPVYVDLAHLGSHFFANVNADGGDIRITTSDATTELPREIVSIDTGGEAGELHFNADSLSSSLDTTFYIYYGNGGASDYADSDPFGAENVWANGYVAVYHFEEDPSGGAPQYTDSTGNSAGTAQNMEGGDQISAQVGNGADIDGTNEFIDTTINQSLLRSTWSIWLDLNGTQGACDGGMFSRGTGANGLNVGACQDTSRLGYHWENLGGTAWDWAGGPQYPTGEWFMASLVIEPTQAIAYVHTESGVASGSNVNTHSSSTIDGLDFGQDPNGGRLISGTIDESRLSSVARSGDWLLSEYRNLASTTDFYGVSSFETATSASTIENETLSDADGTLNFHNVTFGETSGTALWEVLDTLDVNRDLAVAFGTLDQNLELLTVARNFTVGANGFLTAMSTTTFDGSTAGQWTDNNATKQSIGNAVINGTTKTVTMGSNVRAETVTIGADDTLSAGGARTLSISGDFTNNNIFSPQTGTLQMVGTSTNAIIHPGSSSLYNFTNSSPGSNISFDLANVTLLSTFTIATGTVTLPTGTLTVGGSFLNTGGNFAHNNATVGMNSSAAGRSVTQNGGPFLNAFYNLSFTGSGSWSFTDTMATTSNNFFISNGTVTFPSETLTVGADLTVSGGGDFAHNDGEVVFLIADSDTVAANGSPFNDTRFRAGSVSGVWYDLSWEYRVPIIVDSTDVVDDMTDFPIYVDLEDLGASFFENTNAGADIRVTEGDGATEVAREIVSVSTSTETGELYFLADSLSSTTDTTFYIYYGNGGASDYADSDPFGTENVWVNGFEGVFHLEEDPGGSAPQMVDSTGNGHDGTALSLPSGNSVLGQFGQSIDHDGGGVDRVRGPGFSNLGTANQAYSISAWFNPDTGETDGNIIHVSALDTGGGWCLPMLAMNGDSIQAISWIGSQVTALGSTGITQDAWNQAYTTWDAANGLDVYLNGNLEDNTAQGTFTASGASNYIHTGFNPSGCSGNEGGLDGQIDEVRIYNERKSANWIETEYNNQVASTDFYFAGAPEPSPARIFTDTNATVLGNVVIESGTVRFPTGVLSIGGSLQNNDTFDHANGTVRFNSSSGSETIASGDSVFATVDFNSAAGDFTVTEHATATTAFTLTNVSDFVLNSGLVFESTGTFTNAADGALTTWTGSTLKLSGGGEYAINSKTSSGDAYATLLVADETGISMWNSTSSIYTTQASSSIYSQDHNGVDGDLYIFGDYVRSSGTEYWSYATDFDGTALGGGARQANIRVQGGASVTTNGATLMILGSASASTTVDAQSGTFALTAENATVTAEYFEMTGTDVDGFSLISSSTVTSLDNALFTIGAGSGAITVDASTIDTNPASQFFNTNFVTGGGNVNVTLSGSPDSFWWFREGVGDRYGEAFDNNDGDPGSVRWDDSSFSINISGTVYADDGTTPLGGPTCDGSTNNVVIVVDDAAYTDATTCSGLDGSYSFTGVSYNGDPLITVYLNTGGGVQGSVVTKTPTSDVTDLDVYANRVMVRHEDAEPITIEDLALYNEADDTDLRFIAATGSPDTLTVRPDTELIVASSSTFIPGGNITLQSGGSGAVYDGSFHIDDNASFAASSTESYTVGGSLFVDSGATFLSASSTFTFTATTSGKAITAASPLTFNELTFTGVGGSWNLNTDVTVLGDLQVATGTLTGTGGITLPSGSFTGNGLVSLGGGEVIIEETSTLGGTQGWTFNDLTLGSGSVVGTTTPASSATTTILGTLTISSGHFLDAGDSHWDLRGAGSVFVENGTFLEDVSTVRYGGTAAMNILSTGYYDLDLNASAGTPMYTATGLGIIVLNDLTVGGEAATDATFDTNDTALDVQGDVRIRANGTLSGSNSAQFTVGGSWDNDGVFTGSGGTVTFEGTGIVSIAAGASPFSNVEINGTGDFTLTENATATEAFVLTAADDFTLQSGQVLGVGGMFQNDIGGADTVWTGSTLFLFGGGNYEINASTTDDTYEILQVAADTDIRMWNSDAANILVDSSGSLYSMDHADVGGEVYIYGNYPGNGGTDHWSYARDFDGTLLSGGSERKVAVLFASGASASVTSGGLSVLGDPSASTTIENQGSGTYGLLIGGTASTTWTHYEIRDIDTNGLTFSGAPNVVTLSFGDILIEQSGGNGMTVGGSAIDANPAKNFTGNTFATTSVLASAFNVTATGTSVSSWRFTNHLGNLSGEAFDQDPDGDPGYIVWDDSEAVITVSGRVYSDEGSVVSTVCDGSTSNIHLRVAGLTSYSASCDGGTGLYSIPGVSFSTNDTLTVFIEGEAEQAATVSADPISGIGNMDLYEDRVIVRHESTDPLTIDDMAVWDSSDHGDIPFTAVGGAPDTLTLPADTKLIVWNGKEFEPNGNVTVPGGGGGGAHDGSVELYANAAFDATGSETHTIGGSLVSGAGASIDTEISTFIFTTTGAARTVDTNDSALFNLTFNGAGSWNVTNTTLTLGGDLTITQGSVTLPSATTTIGGSLNNTGGSFTVGGGTMLFTSSDAEVIRTNGSDLVGVRVDGAGGSFVMQDTNATATAGFRVVGGSVTLPAGTFTVGGDFVSAGTLTHNSGEVRLISSTPGTSIDAGGSDLSDLTIDGSGTFTMATTSAALLGDLTIEQGVITLPENTLSIGGSLTNISGAFAHASGTVLFNSSDTGENITPNGSEFNTIAIAAPAGGYTLIGDATTTANFSLTNATDFTFQSGSRLYVGGVFTNTVGGSATTWDDTILYIDSGTGYTINTKALGGDQYENLIIGADTDLRMWSSSATSTSVDETSSLYSMDHAGVDGDLYLYSDYSRTVGTDYWSYATDFDGTALGGGSREVNVFFAQNASSTLYGGALQIVGDPAATTTITNQGSGTYALTLNAGTFTATEYAFRNMNLDGLNLTGTATIASLSGGDYELAVSGGSLITLSTTALNVNPGLQISDTRFATTTAISGTNVNLAATTTNSWTFTDHRGNLAGEAFDIDGTDACGSIRWDDSDCQLTEETHYRWRNDDGGEGAPPSEWYDVSWDERKHVRVQNFDGTPYTDAVVKLDVTYDSDMQADFSDLRFTEEDGITVITHWVEALTPSSEADVWVKIPALAADSVTSIFMYYDNAIASSTSSSTDVFALVDDFEDGDIAEYSGDTGLFTVDGAFSYEGSFGLDTAGNEDEKATDGIYRTDVTVEQGQTIRYLQYIDTAAGSGDEVCTLFGVQAPGSSNQNYAVCLEQFGVDRVSIARDVDNTDTSGTVIGTTNITYATGWYEIEIDWQIDDTIEVTVYKDGVLAATTSASDGTYTEGGIGFTFWFQNGGWDSYSARGYIETAPSIFFGAEQSDGGASWAGAQNSPGTGFEIGNTARLRVAIENSGLAITDQLFELEFAPKGSAPSCEAVSAGEFETVPVLASCGSSEVCMATSTHVINGAATTDHLRETEGAFTQGEIVADPSNQSDELDVLQNEYTELEYALMLTNNVADEAYCFRVTSDGVPFDSYDAIPELALQFDPSITALSLNNGFDIALFQGATTTIYATGTVTDLNGSMDLDIATSTIFRNGPSGVGETCVADNNNCYRSVAPQCSFTNCAGSSCEIVCTADMYYFAEPTDAGTYAGDSWTAYLEISDQGGATTSASSPSVDLLTTRALTVDSAIDYGTLGVNTDTGSYNATTTIQNIGNDAIDIAIEGTDLTDGGASSIPVSEQLFATSTFNYSACIFCSSLATTTTNIEVDLSKPTTTTPGVTDDVYWGISIPFGVAGTPHQGQNTFYAIGD